MDQKIEIAANGCLMFSGKATQMIDPACIVLIEVDDHKVIFSLSNGCTESYRSSLKKLCPLLDPLKFMCIARWQLANLTYVNDIFKYKKRGLKFDMLFTKKIAYVSERKTEVFWAMLEVLMPGKKQKFLK